MQSLELHVRADGDVLAFHVTDRERVSTGTPQGTTSLGRIHARARGARLEREIAEACARGEVTAAERESIRAQAQLLHDLLVPAALRPTLRASVGCPLWLRLRGWSRELPWEWLHDGVGYWSMRFAVGRDGGASGPAPLSKPPARFVVLGDEGTLGQTRIEHLKAGLSRRGITSRVHRGPLLRADLRAALQAADIVHVGASATADGLTCADGAFGPEDMPEAGRWPQLLVLSGSSTRAFGEAAQRAGVPTVMAMATPLARGAASSVAGAVYERLLNGACAGEALRAARGNDPEDAGAIPWILLGDPSSVLGPARPSGPADTLAWVGVWVDAGRQRTDPSEAAALRRPIEKIVRVQGEKVGLEPKVSASGHALLFGFPPARFGDRTGEAALSFAERLRELLPESQVAGLTGRLGARLGVGLAVGQGAPGRAVELARRAAPDVLIVDGDGKESSRRERRVFIELRRPTTDGALAWEARPGSMAPPRPLLGRREGAVLTPAASRRTLGAP